eukprot:TRINITY_DN5617_c0_g1_i1.p1 TRINITY_DN5617_c0_g1~~TRINITY_DN5617_c0_g1_i1.p1  ORF type:complete len:230 (+),score=48.99 TRINITY_DN5617_c0_g1_i1:117-806(+)
MSYFSRHNTNELGKTFLWSCMAAQISFSFIFFLSSIRSSHASVRSLSSKYLFSCLLGALSCWLMMNDWGIPHRSESGRTFYSIRYLDWLISAPLLLWEIGNLSKASFTLGGTIVLLIDGIIICSVMALYSSGVYIWRWFGAGCFGSVVFLFIFISETSGLHQYHGFKSTILVIAVFLYCLGWGLCEGGQIIPVDFTHLWFSILDFAVKCVFPFIVLLLLSNNSQHIKSQ